MDSEAVLNRDTNANDVIADTVLTRGIADFPERHTNQSIRKRVKATIPLGQDWFDALVSVINS